MKWNRWIIKAAKIITRFTELGYWMTAALMLTAGIYSFADRTFLADALAGSIRTGRLELSVLGFEFSVPTAKGIDKAYPGYILRTRQCFCILPQPSCCPPSWR